MNTLSFIPGVGGPELVIIFVAILVLFGAKKLPEFAKGLGKSMGEFKRARTEFEDEISRAQEEVTTKPAPKEKVAEKVKSEEKVAEDVA